MRLILFTILILASLKLPAQCPMDWSSTALTPQKFSVFVAGFNSLIDTQNFDEAREVLSEIEKEFPNTDTINVLQTMLLKERARADPTLALQFREKVLEIHETWERRCDNETRVSVRKAYDLYFLGYYGFKELAKKRDQKNQDFIFRENDSLFLNAFEVNGVNVPRYILVPYFNNLRDYRRYTGEISLDTLTMRRDALVTLIENMISLDSSKEEQLRKDMFIIDELYIRELPPHQVDCEFIISSSVLNSGVSHRRR